MFHRIICFAVLFFSITAWSFGQASALRDYVGSISINYHPDVAAYMGKFREAFQKRGYPEAAKAIDNYLKGLSGSGFVYVDETGTNYVITNHHVIQQSDTISIAFEKVDGTKTRYEDLKVLMADEDKDIAILVFTGKPFTQGLAFNKQVLDDGNRVFAAGFPGIGSAAALWQFSEGSISNVAARLPGETEGETIGPYIQHTAPVDPGNSGGPLLVAQPDVLTGYAVAGINTRSIRAHQAANYAIPLSDLQDFLDLALGKKQVNDREILDQRINTFMRGLGANRAVYSHIAPYLTGACTALNAEFAISELLEKGSRTVLTEIDGIFTYNPVEGMNAATAWLIENSLRTKTGSIKINLDSVNPRGGGQEGYTVTFVVNDKTISSEWVKEYGIWRIESFGDTVTGDKSLLSAKEKRQQQDKNLKVDNVFQIDAGIAYIIDTGPAFTLNLGYRYDFTSAGFRFYFRGADFIFAEVFGGFFIPIKINSVALIPYGEVAGGISYWGTKKNTGPYGFDDTSEPDLSLAFSAQGGLMFTTAAVPGLYFRGAYQYTIHLASGHPNLSMAIFTVGYAF